MSYLDDIKQKEKEKSTTQKEKAVDKGFKFSLFSFLTVHGSKFSIILLVLAPLLIILISSYDFSEGGFSLRNIDATAIILAVLVYLLYINCYPTGKQCCQGWKVYKESFDEYKKKIDDISERKVEYKIYDFVRDHVAEDLKTAQLNKLHSNNLTFEDFELYLKGELDKPINEGQEKALEETKALKPKRLTKAQIYNESDNDKRKDFISSDTGIWLYRAYRWILKLLTTALSVFFTYQLSCSIVLDFSHETLMKELLHLIIIVLTVFSGLKHGWDEEILQLKRCKERIAVLNSFFSWEERADVKARYQN